MSSNESPAVNSSPSSGSGLTGAMAMAMGLGDGDGGAVCRVACLTPLVCHMHLISTFLHTASYLPVDRYRKKGLCAICLDVPVGRADCGQHIRRRFLALAIGETGTKKVVVDFFA